jgi:GNAT superfamily N-acetyltransferase
VRKKPRIAIREAQAADLPALTWLCGELGYASDLAQVQRRFERIAGESENSVFVAEETPGAVVGWVQVHFTRWLASDARGEVVGLVVSAKTRGRGIGRRLMAAAEKWTQERGGALMVLRCNILRTETHAFYARLGYTSSIKTRIIA